MAVTLVMPRAIAQQPTLPKIKIAVQQHQEQIYPKTGEHRGIMPEGSIFLVVKNDVHQWVYMKLEGHGVRFEGFLAPNTEEDWTHLPQGAPLNLVQLELPAQIYTIQSFAKQLDNTTATATLTIEGLSTEVYDLRVTPDVVAASDKPAVVPPTSNAVSNSLATNPIQSAIDAIAQGAHQDLPQPEQTQVGPGQSAGWSIKNATAHQIHLYLSGPIQRDYVIPPGNSIAIDLPPGNYRIAADVPDQSVIPFYAVRQLNANIRWSTQFYIQRQ
jgi:hypothetical protein